MIKLVSLSLALMLSALPVWAVELPVGKWSGSYSFADDDPLQVKYQVKKLVSEQDPLLISWKITMNAAGVAIKFSEIQLLENQLSFRMNPGEEVSCLLNSGEGGVYKGKCISVANPETNQMIKIFMRPPAIEVEVPEKPADNSTPAIDTEGNTSDLDGDEGREKSEEETSSGQPT